MSSLLHRLSCEPYGDYHREYEDRHPNMHHIRCTAMALPWYCFQRIASGILSRQVDNGFGQISEAII